MAAPFPAFWSWQCAGWANCFCPGTGSCCWHAAGAALAGAALFGQLGGRGPDPGFCAGTGGAAGSPVHPIWSCGLAGGAFVVLLPVWLPRHDGGGQAVPPSLPGELPAAQGTAAPSGADTALYLPGRGVGTAGGLFGVGSGHSRDHRFAVPWHRGPLRFPAELSGLEPAAAGELQYVVLAGWYFGISTLLYHRLRHHHPHLGRRRRPFVRLGRSAALLCLLGVLAYFGRDGTRESAPSSAARKSGSRWWHTGAVRHWSRKTRWPLCRRPS